MLTCPTHEELLGFLSGTLRGASSETVSSHIDHCKTCQSTLDRLTEDHNVDLLKEGDTASFNDPSDAFLEKLKSSRAESARPSQPLPNIPGYEILEELGRGGAGIVYRARQLALHRTVAIKVLLGSGAAFADDVERFRTEALAAGRLNHSGIVRVHEVGEWSQTPDGARLPYVCLEFVAGGTLDGLIDGRPQSARTAAETIVQLAGAVQAAHQEGIVHRDLKPANVLIDAATGAPKVADFGLAKHLDLGAGNTATGMILGTPSYMAPEQARGLVKQIDVRTDVYALGAVLYELLTGRPPFQGLTPLDTVLQVAEDDPIPPRSLVPTVPRDLETVCLKCLEKNPARRYESAQALADDVGRFLAGKPTVARPLGRFGRSIKMMCRHPVPASLLAALALVIFGSIAGLTHLYLKSERDRKAAVKEREHAQQAQEGTQAMNEFLLEQVLQAARLSREGDGRKVTVLQMLDAASPQVAAAFAKQPQIAASVHYSLGQSFQQYGEFEKSANHLAESLRIRREMLGDLDELTLNTMLELAVSYDSFGKSVEAKNLLNEALAGFIRIGQGQSDGAIAARLNLGQIARDAGDMKEAERWIREMANITREVNGPNHPRTLEAELGLCEVIGIVNGPETVLVPLRELIARCEQQFGKRGLGTVATRGRLIQALIAIKRFDEAEPIAAEVLAAHREIYGMVHPVNFKTQAELADCWAAQQKYKEADAAYREAIQGFRDTMPPDVSLVPNAMTRLGVCLMKQDRFAEAEKMLLDAQEKFKTATHCPPQWKAANKAALETLEKQRKKTGQ